MAETRTWVVFQNGRRIAGVDYDASMSAGEVRAALVREHGYSWAIQVMLPNLKSKQWIDEQRRSR